MWTNFGGINTQLDGKPKKTTVAFWPPHVFLAKYNFQPKILKYLLWKSNIPIAMIIEWLNYFRLYFRSNFLHVIFLHWSMCSLIVGFLMSNIPSTFLLFEHHWSHYSIGQSWHYKLQQHIHVELHLIIYVEYSILIKN